MKPDKAHCSVEHDYSCELPRLVVAEGGRLLKLHFSRSPASEWNTEMFYNRGGLRGKCKGFSFGSRRRMLDRLNSVSVASVLPEFVTMTLPDEVFRDSVGEFARCAKHWLDTWLKRLVRVCPGACGFWRIEWKARETGLHVGKLFPHFHLLIWGLPQREVFMGPPGEGQVWEPVFESYVPCRDNQLALSLLGAWSERSRTREEWQQRREGAEYVFAGSAKFVARCGRLHDAVVAEPAGNDGARNMSFQDWASIAWYHVVDSHNLDHAQAGVRVERVRTWGGVMSYCSKYMAKADAEFMADISWGRSWGIFNRACMPWAKLVEIHLDNEMGVAVRRVARRYLEHRFGRRVRAPYGLTVYCDTSQFRRLWEHPPPDPF